MAQRQRSGRMVSGNGSRRAGARRNGVAGLASQAYDEQRREQLAGIQRARIVSAMFDVACERGAGSLSVAHVVGRSGVSRRTFYELFTDREDCMLAAFEDAVSYAAERVVPAYQGATGWRERIRAGLVTLLSFIDEQPRIGRMLIVESLSGGPRVLARRGEVIQRLTGAIDEGGKEAKQGAPPPALTAEGTVGGVLTVLHSRLASGDGAPLIELTGPLMSMIVLPYLGPAAARREAARPASYAVVNAPLDSPLLADPFKDAGMRLTYRTVRVLIAVAMHPGGSNRLIGTTAGIEDQGQISKLLGRLQRIGLVANTGLEAGKGMPNAWSLTEKGRRVAEGVHAYASEEPKQ